MPAIALYEKYRPQTLDDVVGQQKVVKRLKMMSDRNSGSGGSGGSSASAAGGNWDGYPNPHFGGQVFWISGPSGSGKTTLARIIAEMTCDGYAIIEIDASKLNVDTLRDFERSCQFRPIGKKGYHGFIVNEAHNLSGRVVSELQTVLEDSRVQLNSLWVFTTTTAGQQKLFDVKFDAVPFMSRCIRLELSPKGHELEFAERVQQIAQAEGLDGKPIEAYLELIRQCNGNMRAAIRAIESGEMMD